MNAWIIVQVWFFQHDSTIPCHVKPPRTVAISSCLTLHISCISHHKNSKLPTFWFAGGWLDCVLSSVASPEGFPTQVHHQQFWWETNGRENTQDWTKSATAKTKKKFQPVSAWTDLRPNKTSSESSASGNVASPTHCWQWKLATTTSYAYQKGPWSSISGT